MRAAVTARDRRLAGGLPKLYCEGYGVALPLSGKGLATMRCFRCQSPLFDPTSPTWQPLVCLWKSEKGMGRRWRTRTLFAIFAGSIWSQAAFAETFGVPLFLSASNDLQQGFVRIVNRSDASGAVAVHAIDDSGQRFGPVSFVLNARATKHFNSQDLELGNVDKGFMSGIGGGQGDWRLEIETDLDIEPLAYVRTADGFLTSMHDVVLEADGSYRVPIFNPASNRDQASRLRLVNPNDADAVATLTGLDDSGAAPPAAR